MSGYVNRTLQFAVKIMYTFIVDGYASVLMNRAIPRLDSVIFDLTAALIFFNSTAAIDTLSLSPQGL